MRAFVKDGVVVGIYSTDVKTPTDCEIIELSGRTDLPQVGWLYEDGKFVSPTIAVPTTTLTDVQNAALTVIDKAASHVRSTYIGDLQNQFGIYTAKFQDAKAYKMGILGTDVANYVWLAAEVSATGDTATVCADRFISLYSDMVSALSKAEEVRIFGKDAIRTAKTIESVREAKFHVLTELNKLVKPA